MSDRSKRVGLLILGLVVTAIFVNLGNWQLERGEGKRAALARFEDHARSPAFDLEGIEKSKILDKVGQSAFANGGYRLDTVTILDNQLLGGRTGYLVYTAYRIGQTDRHVLVNRGWVEANPDRYQLPEIAANPLSPHVTGRLSAPPSEGIRLAGADMIESMGQGIWRVQKIDFDALSSSFGLDLLPVSLLLDNGMPGGFIRNWRPPGLDATRHFGYAFQWFALALAVALISVGLFVRSMKQERS